MLCFFYLKDVVYLFIDNSDIKKNIKLLSF